MCFAFFCFVYTCRLMNSPYLTTSIVICCEVWRKNSQILLESGAYNDIYHMEIILLQVIIVPLTTIPLCSVPLWAYAIFCIFLDFHGNFCILLMWWVVEQAEKRSKLGLFTVDQEATFTFGFLFFHLL